MGEKTEKLSISDGISLFIQKNKVLLLALLGLAIAAVIGILVFTFVQEGLGEASAKAMDDITDKYQSYSQLENGDAKKAEAEKAITEAIDALVKKYPSLIAAQQALILGGDLSIRKEDPKTAGEYYFRAYEANKKNFVAPFALKSAAAAAEDAGDAAKAIGYDEIIIKDYKDSMPGISLVYFNLGRLYESEKNYAKAVETFAKMGDLFPIDSWTNLAKSRIIYLKSQGLAP